jgi:hypothetical protein
MVLLGEPDPEKQGELFLDWRHVEESLPPRDIDAALWALSRMRAEYGEGSLCLAHLRDHAVPGRDHVFTTEKESRSWFASTSSPAAGPAYDLRVRRHLSVPFRLSSRDRWDDKEGPFLLQGGWWEHAPVARRYYFARQGRQTGWLYWDETCGCWFVQGWLQ